VLRLHRNLGHQRAIAIGLVHTQMNFTGDAVLVMDADGEDTPEGVVQLIGAFAADRPNVRAIFAERSRRTESFAFRCFYQLYKLLHRVFAGVKVRVGNFSILPTSQLRTLVVMSELWNHYAAAFFRSGLPLTTLPIPRGYRIAGTSKMNFVSLTTHGMSAISVFGDVVATRLLIASIAGSALAALGIAIVVAVRVFTDQAIPGWATYSTGVFAIILIQLFTISISLTFTMLSNRINFTLIPMRDCVLFVDDVKTVYGGDGPAR
jgi:hypothetical protein